MQEASYSGQIITLNDVDFRFRFYEESELFSTLFCTRNRIFRDDKMFYYDDEGCHHDKCPHTLFLVVTDTRTGKIAGGLSFVIHEPTTDVILSTEEFTCMNMQDMLPHYDTKNMRYGEIKGIFLDKAGRRQQTGERNGIYQNMMRLVYDLIKTMDFDFVVILPIPSNYQPTLKYANNNGALQTVTRSEPAIITKLDGEGGPVVMTSFTRTDLISSDMRNQGINGAELTQAQFQTWKRQYELATTRSAQVA